MALHNTTPTPNMLFDKEMREMSDTELRVVLIVIRATLGWEKDKTGSRKSEDWLSYYQIKQKTGRGYTAIAKAIDTCICRCWIEARDGKGNILDHKNKRIGKKVFYRLGKALLNNVITSLGNEESVPSTSPESVITDSIIAESGAYKINTIQKKNYTKGVTASPDSGEVLRNEVGKQRQERIRRQLADIREELTEKLWRKPKES